MDHERCRERIRTDHVAPRPNGMSLGNDFDAIIFKLAETSK